MYKRSISSIQKAYLAGFLDGDGSIYVRLKPNPTYKFGFQVAPYIVLFQSAKGRKNFDKVCSLIGFGYMRERKDGILEYTVGKLKDIDKLLSMIEKYVILKKEQVKLMRKILILITKVQNKKDFSKLMNLVNIFGELNYSKKRKTHILTP